MRKGLIFGLLVLVLAGGLGTLYISQARESAPAAQLPGAAAAGPRLRVVAATPGPTQRDVTLLADVKPYLSTTMYGKLGGYLKTLNVDRGDHVKEGQIIAEMESEETDSQYVAALADLANKKRLAQRDKEMLTAGHVSKQAADNSDTAMRMAEANVRQLASLKSYEILRAPFDGTVTMRFVDPGALISNASTNQSNALPVIILADTSKLRVATYVEQADVPYVRVGTPVEIADSTDPERKVTATVSRTAGTLDQKTRTLTIEIDVDNSNDFLAAGSFAHVTLHLPVESRPQVPAAALVTRGDDQMLACLDATNQVHFRPVKLGGAVGPLLTIAEGIEVGERVVLTPPTDLAEGTKIEPIVAAAPAR
jgi:membrane fusion protein (multidrug efflux system)